MKNIVALEGKQIRYSVMEKAILEALRQAGGPLSAVGLSRWVKKNPDLMKADKDVLAAVEKLWAGMLVTKYEDNTYSLSGN
jgi:hypothetical protein